MAILVQMLIFRDKRKNREQLHIEQEPGGVNLAEKVTNFDMVSNDLHI